MLTVPYPYSYSAVSELSHYFLKPSAANHNHIAIMYREVQIHDVRACGGRLNFMVALEPCSYNCNRQSPKFTPSQYL